MGIAGKSFGCEAKQRQENGRRSGCPRSQKRQLRDGYLPGRGRGISADRRGLLQPDWAFPLWLSVGQDGSGRLVGPCPTRCGHSATRCPGPDKSLGCGRQSSCVAVPGLRSKSNFWFRCYRPPLTRLLFIMVTPETLQNRQKHSVPNSCCKKPISYGAARYFTCTCSIVPLNLKGALS
jgi:hypothetical protein